MLKEYDELEITIFWLYPVDERRALIRDAIRLSAKLPANLSKDKRAIWCASLNPEDDLYIIKNCRGLEKKYRMFLGERTEDGKAPVYPYAEWENAVYVGRGVKRR